MDILIFLSLVSSITAICLVIYSLVSNRRMSTRFEKFFAANNEELDLEKLLIDCLDKVTATSRELNRLDTTYDELLKNATRSYQKMGLIRFNPFRDTGGDQSFALCLLDGYENGIIITAIHGREGTRIYTKPIEYGNCVYSLSKEEEAALNYAIKNKTG